MKQVIVPERAYIVDMVVKDTGMIDPAGATDNQLIAAYLNNNNNNNMPESAALWYIDELRGRSHADGGR